MKIAVLGGGTAGFIAAAHLTKKIPDAELLHVYDSRIPTIGVGEGTTPRFPIWFRDITGGGLEDLAARCGATLKTGTRFEGWGRAGHRFVNRFQPVSLIGFHFNAACVVEAIAEHVRAERIDARILDVAGGPSGAEVRLEDGQVLRCAYVFDARGFPPETRTPPLDAGDFVQLDWIPTGRALLRRLPGGGFRDVTRAIARPHGWVFQIPLRDTTSSGYVFNPALSTEAEVAEDFDRLLAAEAVGEWEERGAIGFPNFARRRVFDGRIFRIGNAASFVEPLEATAIGTGIAQVRAAEAWIIEHGEAGDADPREIDAYNRRALGYVLRNSLFIAWHYACGSQWATPFWDHARSALDRARASTEARRHLDAMDPFVRAGEALPGLTLSSYSDTSSWDREVYPLLSKFVPFGNFSELNFAQVGHGIGYYATPPGEV